MDNKKPDDWYDDLRNREMNPDPGEQPQERYGLRDRLGDEAKSRASDATKKYGKKALKQGAKRGSSQAASGAAAGAEGAAAAGSGAAAAGGAAAGAGGAAAAGGGGVAAGASIAATTGVETAGIGVAVGAAVALVSSKKGRKIVAAMLILPLILIIIILPAIAIMIPKMVTSGVSNVAMNVVENIPIVRGGIIVANGINYAADTAANAADAAGEIGSDGITILGEGVSNAVDIVDDIDVPFVRVEFHDSAKALALNGSVQTGNGEVLGVTAGDAAGTPLDKDSRLAALYQAMQDKGYFQKVLEKNKVKVVYLKNKHFRIFLEGKQVAEVDSASKIAGVFQKNKKLNDIIIKSMQDDLKVWNYSQRVTLAEKALENYETSKLYLPGADVATDATEIAEVKKNSKKTVNKPFVGELSGSLRCVQSDCGDWVPATVEGDDNTLADNISKESGYTTKGTLDSLMRKRFKEARRDGDLSMMEMLRYVAELREAAKLTDQAEIQNNSFIQGVAKTRKDQSARLWFHTQTMVDQFTANKMTSATATALFKDLNGIGSSKAYKIITGNTGGNAFKEYEKINDNQLNIATKIYETWKNKNPQHAGLIDKIADQLNSWLGGIADFVGVFDNFLSFSNDDEELAVALESAYDFASQATIPTCDSAKTGETLMNCMFAGAQVTARDVGISDYGLNGEISEQDRQEMLSYVNETESRIASTRPISERLFSTQTSTSFLGSFLLRSELPFDVSSNPASLLGYLAKTPQRLLADIRSPLSSKVSAADDLSTVNNIKNAGMKLSTLKDTPLSITLNSSSGDTESCPAAQENQENTCIADETTYKALAAKFDVEPELEGAVGSINIATYNTLTSNFSGSNRPGWDEEDAQRYKSIAEFIISKNLHIVGTQETRNSEREALVTALPGYGATPLESDVSDIVFYDSSLFTQEEVGYYDIPKSVGSKKAMWVKLKSATGGSIYVFNLHAMVGTSPGDQSERTRDAEITIQKIREVVGSSKTPVVVLGDMNSNTSDPARDQVYKVFKASGLLDYTFERTDSLKGEHCDTHQSRDGRQDCRPGGRGSHIDHIWISKDPSSTINSWENVADDVTIKLSDHNPVIINAAIPGITGQAKLNLRLATYNVWGDSHSGSNVNDSDRINRQIELIRNNEIGVVGLQEIEHTQLQRIKERMTDYDVYPENGVFGTDRTSADSIIWNKAKYTRVSAGVRTHLYKNGSVRKHPFVLLQDNATKQKFFVINTHDPSEPQFAEARFKNANDYVDDLKDFNAKGYPVFMTGDFNSGYWVRSENNTTYQGERKNLTYCILTRDGTMWDAYDSLLDRKGECPTSDGNQPGQAECSPNDIDCNNRPGNAVDHIFMSKSVKTTRFWHIKSNRNGSDVHDTVIADTVYGENDNERTGGKWEWPVKRANWPNGSMPLAECGLKYSDGTVHTGIDISVPNNTPLVAATDATVRYVGGSYGAIIAETKQKAPNGSTIYINYQHMSYISVGVGDEIKAGEPVGRSGNKGTGAYHLHFGVWKTGSFLSGHDSVGSAAGQATLSKMLHPLNYLPDDGRNVAECREPYVLP